MCGRRGRPNGLGLRQSCRRHSDEDGRTQYFCPGTKVFLPRAHFFSISPRLIWFPGNQPPGPVTPMFAMKEAKAAALAILPTLFVGVAAARR